MIRIFRKYKTFFSDVALNIISSAFPIIILQVLILPLVAEAIGSENFGVIIVIVSIVSIFSQSVGSALNNTRLLQDNKYTERKNFGDFNLILLSSTLLINIIIFLIIYITFENISAFSTLLICVFCTLVVLKTYYPVEFRINLNYRKIAISSGVLGISYLAGYYFFRVTEEWLLIYLTGNTLLLIYLMKNTSLYKESFKKTYLFKQTFSLYMKLLLAGLLLTATVYADKIILQPILGLEAVTIYYSATVVSKLLGLVITPINGVILSYLVKVENITINQLNKVLLGSITIAFFGYFASVYLGEILLIELYPEWAEKSIGILYLTSLTAMISLITTAINPYLMRFIDKIYQVYFNAVYLIVYIACSLLLVNAYGLYGFCIAIMFASILNFLLRVLILYKKIKNMNG